MNVLLLSFTILSFKAKLPYGQLVMPRKCLQWRCLWWQCWKWRGSWISKDPGRAGQSPASRWICLCWADCVHLFVLRMTQTSGCWWPSMKGQFESHLHHLLAGWPWASCLIFYICLVSTSCCGNNWVNIYKVLRTVPGAKGVDNKYLLMLLQHYVGRFHLRTSENKRMSSDITGFLDPAVPEALHLLYFQVPINPNQLTSSSFFINQVWINSLWYPRES